MTVKPFIYRFDNVRVETAEFRVFKNGELLTLEPKAFQVLIFLLEQRGRLVSKDELLDAVWKDAFVTPNVLTRIVAQLRRALGDESNNSRYIKTVPTHGYRFIAKVEAEKDVEGGLLQADAGEQIKIPANETAKQDEKIEPHSDAPIARSFWKVIAAALLLLTATAGIVYFVSTKNLAKTETNSQVSEQTLAVLPFKLLNPNDESNYLSIEFADSLITKLSSVRSLTVRPTNSVIRYALNKTDAADAGRELKVGTVIDGTIQQVGDRMRVSVQLVRVSDGKPMWANSYDTPFANIFQVQDDISARIAEALKIRLSNEEQTRLARRPTDNIEAYQLCLRGYYHLYKSNPDDMKLALRYYNEAIALDADYAFAYAGLAYAYGIASSFNVPQAAQLAEINATKAVELDPTLGEAHAALGTMQFWGHHDIGKAQDSFVHALELNPNSAQTHEYYGWFLVATAHFDEAERHFRRALELDPMNIGTIGDQGLPLFFNRRYNEARTRFAQASELAENSFLGHMWIGEACEGAGDLVCAFNELERAFALSHDDPVVKTQFARTLALAGRKDESRRLLKEITANAALSTSPYYIALADTALDEPDEAFANLERAITENDKWLGWAKVDPRLDTLRQDARFDDILRRTNLK